MTTEERIEVLEVKVRRLMAIVNKPTETRTATKKPAKAKTNTRAMLSKRIDEKHLKRAKKPKR